MSITTSAGWEAIGTHRQLGGYRVFTIDAPAIGPEVHQPLLILHGFPTSSFDYAAVLDGAARPGDGCCSSTAWATDSRPSPISPTPWRSRPTWSLPSWPSLDLPRLSLLTHDVGDTVGGELLARRQEGRWPVEVTHA